MDITKTNWATPNSHNANIVIDLNLNGIADSFCYLYEYSGRVDSRLRTFLDKNRSVLRKNMPQAFLYHEYMVRNAESSDFELQGVFDHLFTELEAVSASPIEIVPFGKRYQVFTNKVLQSLIAEDHLECYGEFLVERNQGITTPNSEQFQYTQKEVQKCLSHIESSCPALYEEINTVISQIHIMSSPHVNAGSYLSMLGMFNIRYLKSDVEHWSRLAEHIIHESAHNLLYQLWYQEPIITSDDGVFYTPFRKDERPISGVYHAMFVLARTIYGFNQLLSNSDIELKQTDISSHYNEANNEKIFTEKFFQTVEVIEYSGRVTPFGQKIMSDCINLVKGCQYLV